MLTYSSVHILKMIDITTVLVWLTIIYTSCMARSFSVTKDFFARCSDITGKSVEQRIVYAHWPFRFNCEKFLPRNISIHSSECYYINDGNFTKVNLASEDVILSEQFPLMSSFLLVQFVNHSLCWKKRINLELRMLPTRSCYEDVDYELRRYSNALHLTVEVGQPFTIKCKPPPGSGNRAIMPPSIVDKVVWRFTKMNAATVSINRNDSCQNATTKINSSRFDEEYDDDGHLMFKIGEARLSDTGVYSCEITSNGQTAYIAHYSVCSRRRVNLDDMLSVDCNFGEQVVFQQDQKVKIACKVYIPGRITSSSSLMMLWKVELTSNSLVICSGAVTLTKDSLHYESPQGRCSLVKSSDTGKNCFRFYTDFLKRTNREKGTIFDVLLELPEMKRKNAGNYTLNVTYSGVTSAKTITLVYDPQKELKHLTKSLAAVSVIMVAVAATCVLMWCNRYKIFLLVQHHFYGYDKDDKHYVAYISYHISDKMPDDIKKKTEKVVSCIKKLMKEMNYSFYDGDLNNDADNVRWESLLEKLEECHRTIVVLTDAYINDSWSRLQLLRSYESLTNKQTKLIFIALAGANVVLERVSKQDKDLPKKLHKMLQSHNQL
ncbi:uncharacterized protein LOC143458869 isoform X2 [Clavelina lepadiformis]|uniref:uncharacterized protein LOC143458869 isoform X2 n=1 Tax=Clavelina lepadiformis TaxID=159417 RepID=UPI004041B605